MLKRRSDLALANSQHGNGGVMMACEVEFWNVLDSGSIPELESILYIVLANNPNRWAGSRPDRLATAYDALMPRYITASQFSKT